MAEATWRKSSYSEKYNCVEVALSSSAAAVRDSKDPAGGVLRVSSGRWRGFVDAVKSGRFAG